MSVVHHVHSPALADFSWTPRVTATLYDGSTFAYKADLADTFGHSWQDNLSQPGVGRLTVQNTDPVLASVAFGDLVTFSIDGSAAFTFVVESMVVRAVAAGEEHDQTTEVSGRGALAQLAKAVVYLERNRADWYPYADERTFSFASIFYEMDDAWVTPISLGIQGETQVGWQGEDGTDAPHGWPARGAHFLWAPGSGEDSAAIGTCYFRGVAVYSEDRNTQVFATADEFFRFYIDGIPMLAEEASMGGWRKTYSTQVAIKGIPGGGAGLAGHIFAFRAQNVSIGSPGDAANAAMVIMAQHDLDPASGLVGDVVFLTNDDPTMWWVLPYPAEPPGWTVGAVMLQLLNESGFDAAWFGRGVPMSFTPTFTKTHDSAGAAWPVQTDITVKVGEDYLSVFMMLAASLCDLAVSPDGSELHAWLYGTRGSAAALTLTPGVNLTELTHDGKW